MAINSYGNQTTSGFIGGGPPKQPNPGASRGITNNFVQQGNANIQNRGATGLSLANVNGMQAPGSAPISQSSVNGVPTFTNMQQQVSGGMQTIRNVGDEAPADTVVQTGQEFIDQQEAGNARVAAISEEKRQSQLPNINVNTRTPSGKTSASVYPYQRTIAGVQDQFYRGNKDNEYRLQQYRDSIAPQQDAEMGPNKPNPFELYFGLY